MEFVFTYSTGLDTFRWQIPLMSRWFNQQGLNGSYLEFFLFTRNEALALTNPEHPEALVKERARELGEYLKDNNIKNVQVHWPLPERIYDRAGQILVRVLDFLSSAKESSPETQFSMNHHYINKSPFEEAGLTREELLKFAAADTGQAKVLIRRYAQERGAVLEALRRENNPPSYPEPRKFMHESDSGDLVPEDSLFLPEGLEAMLDIGHAYATVGFLNEMVDKNYEALPANMRGLIRQYNGIPNSCNSFEEYVQTLAGLRRIGWAHVSNISDPKIHQNLIPNHPEGIISMGEVLGVLRRSLASKSILPVTVEVDFPYIEAEKAGKTPIRDSIRFLYDSL